MRPSPIVGDGEALISYIEREDGDLTEKGRINIKSALDSLATQLAALPAQTREFLAMLFERREPDGTSHFNQDYGWESMLFSTLERIYQGEDLKGELDILENAGFVELAQEDRADDRGPAAVGFRIKLDSNKYHQFFALQFIFENELSFRTVLGDVDLSAF